MLCLVGIVDSIHADNQSELVTKTFKYLNNNLLELSEEQILNIIGDMQGQARILRLNGKDVLMALQNKIEEGVDYYKSKNNQKYQALARGFGYAALGLVSAAAAYYFYKNWYKASWAEIGKLCKDNNIVLNESVTYYGRDQHIMLDIRVPYNMSIEQRNFLRKRLIELREKAAHGVPGTLTAGGFSLSLLACVPISLRDFFHPQYKEHYEKMNFIKMKIDEALVVSTDK